MASLSLYELGFLFCHCWDYICEKFSW